MWKEIGNAYMPIAIPRRTPVTGVIIGDDGIPLRDEIELEMMLDNTA